MDTASVDGVGALARNVEQCRCPPNYRGSSCEVRCQVGTIRAFVITRVKISMTMEVRGSKNCPWAPEFQIKNNLNRCKFSN